MKQTTANIKFDVDDPDFKEFLPQENLEMMSYRWTDFNTHDPGVTLLEAIRFSFEDLSYKSRLPIADLLQGKHQNALEGWSLLRLYTRSAVTENDYRRILAYFEGIRNAAVLPAPTPHVSHNKQAQLGCLLNAWIAPDRVAPDEQLIEKALLNYRGVGEYYNRADGNETMVREKVVSLNMTVKVIFHSAMDTGENKKLLRKALEDYLLPKLHLYNYRNQSKTAIGKIHCVPDPPAKDPILIDPEQLNKPCYRNKIVVAKLYQIIQQFDFIQQVITVKVGRAGGTHEEATVVLHLDDFYFCQLDSLVINGNRIENKPKDTPSNTTPLHAFNGPTQIHGKYRNNGKFNSLQQSFPPNYGIGHWLDASNREQSANFRTFLAFQDQVRGDLGVQMGNLNQIFTIKKEAVEVQTNNLSDHDFYKDLQIPPPEKISFEFNEAFESKRLDYLLALHGWNLDNDFPFIGPGEKWQELKRAFLFLIHYRKEALQEVNNHLNPIFQANTLCMLQEQIRILSNLGNTEVRILEHCFLQPVADAHFGLNFELTVFVFNSEGPSEVRHFLDMLDKLIPAHLTAHLKFVTDRTIAAFDQLLNRAFPPESIFYFNNQFNRPQLQAMYDLMNRWIRDYQLPSDEIADTDN